ncbi:hypothetical protein OIV83_005844 [Microbotryomycetes sp. JL201]|nr:hypothetical protein OIV83_005844 [Microbotryomycetes sp. JL201]
MSSSRTTDSSWSDSSSAQSSPLLQQYPTGDDRFRHGVSPSTVTMSSPQSLVLDFAGPGTRLHTSSTRRRTSWVNATPQVDANIEWSTAYAQTSFGDDKDELSADDESKRAKAQSYRRRALSKSPQWAQSMSQSSQSGFLTPQRRAKARGCLNIAKKLALIGSCIVICAVIITRLVKTNSDEAIETHLGNGTAATHHAQTLQDGLARTKHALEAAIDHQSYEGMWDSVLHAPSKFKKIVHDFGDKWTGTRQTGRPIHKSFNYSLVLKPGTENEPTLRARLRDDIRYITAIPYGGHANIFIGLQRLILLGKMTNRVAILPTFDAAHVRGDAQPVDAFYDLDRFYAETRIPIVPMNEIKKMGWTGTAPRLEKIACWSVAERTIGQASPGIEAFARHDLDPRFFPLPNVPRAAGGFDLSFDGLKLFDFQDKSAWIKQVREQLLPQRPDATPKTQEDKLKNVKDRFDPVNGEVPSDQLFCLDNSFFIGPVMFPETIHDGLPEEPKVPGEGDSWIQVGQHLHFTEPLESAADEVLMELFQVSRRSLIPPYISVHIRRGDFKDFTGFTSLERYTAALDKVRMRLQERIENPYNWEGPGRKHFQTHGISAFEYPIVATTDESPDSDFVKQVRALGWHVLDHQKFGTAEKWGPWYPSMLDAVILSRGKSFVATSASTYSHLAGLRVKFWHGGLVEVA